MALAGAPPVPDRQPSPRPLTLSSNNPFRNRTVSPPTRSPGVPVPASNMSKNPFLDVSELPAASSSSQRTNPPLIPDDIFSDFSLLDRPSSSRAAPPPPPPPPYSSSSLPRAGTLPVQGSQSSSRREKAPPRPSRDRDSPRREHRPRRASESSIMENREKRPRDPRDRADRPPRTESEERRRRERRREREERHRLGERSRDERSRDGKARTESSRRGEKVKKPKGLDIIDKLDVTGIYGQGLFHHDGPFDACNPHRNVKKDRRAPMQAFPEGSANMALGGAGPLKSGVDLDMFHGRGQEGFSEYAAARKAEPTIVDSTARFEPVHGEETYGLGTSTFLEGAPASRKDLQRRDSDEPSGESGGLSRKKSLAQRFRGMSNGRRTGSNDLRTPEVRYYGAAGSSSNPNGDMHFSPPPMKASSAGGISRAKYNKENEINPFDNDYEAAFEKKGTQIRIAEHERATSSHGRPRAPSSPRGNDGATLVKSNTLESTGNGGKSSNEEDRPAANGGFLKRMKSLKGGSRRN